MHALASTQKKKKRFFYWVWLLSSNVHEALAREAGSQHLPL